MLTSIKIEITPMWSAIADIKEKVKISMVGMPRGNIDFTVMVASELLENAIKYGIANNESSQVDFEFEIDHSKVSLNVRNGIAHGPNLDKFLLVMNKINASENKKNLYLERLQEIMDDPTQLESCLGLYRIISEVEFDLNYRLNNNILEMIATKHFAEEKNAN
jgi:hypothetical protein